VSTANLDAADLKAVTRGGLIREDVMNKIWDISKIPLPLTDMIGSDTASHPYKEWTTDELAAPNLANARVDGADASGNDTVTGARVGNHHQISDKVVKVSYRADVSNTIGRSKELAYQLSRRQQELRRDIEAISLNNQASVADDGNTIAGKVGTLPSWIKTNHINGTPGGFSAGSGLTVARTPGANQGLTETVVRTACEQVYNQGGEASIMMSRPAVIKQFSSYLFTASARVATLMSDIEGSAEKATAMGSVNVFVTDFGTLKMIPNRLQPLHASTGSVTAGSFVVGTSYIILTVGTTDYTLIGAASNTVGVAFTATGVGAGTGTANVAVTEVFVLDPQYLSMCYFQGFRTETLAKTGTAENRQMLVDWTLIVKNEKSQALIGDINPATAVIA